MFLVACCAKKLDRAAPARDLYVSPWFKKARRYVEALGAPWFILSAKHWLLDPDAIIEPYDARLASMSKPTRQAWALNVAECLTYREPHAHRIVILAGVLYREHLARSLRASGYTVHVPMAGLGIGQQLRWLWRAWLAARAAVLADPDVHDGAPCHACGEGKAHAADCPEAG